MGVLGYGATSIHHKRRFAEPAIGLKHQQPPNPGTFLVVLPEPVSNQPLLNFIGRRVMGRIVASYKHQAAQGRSNQSAFQRLDALKDALEFV